MSWVVDESIRFLETRDRMRPFFLMASFVRPHSPFDAPAEYFEMYYGKELVEPALGDWVDRSLTESDGMVIDSVHGRHDAELRHQAMAGYYACITHIHHQIGRLVTALEPDATCTNTVVVFTSDHGEMLFDHEKFRKVLPYEGSPRVPLIVRCGRMCVCPARTRCPFVVSAARAWWSDDRQRDESV
nr:MULTISPECIES: sulfatase-like hydrolase/transferase [unclassified Collinsella]